MRSRWLALAFQLAMHLGAPAVALLATPSPALAVRSTSGSVSSLEDRITSKFEAMASWVKNGAIALMLGLAVSVGFKFATGHPQAWRHLLFFVVGGVIIALANELVTWTQE